MGLSALPCHISMGNITLRVMWTLTKIRLGYNGVVFHTSTFLLRRIFLKTSERISMKLWSGHVLIKSWANIILAYEIFRFLRQYVLLRLHCCGRRHEISTKLHGVTSQETVILKISVDIGPEREVNFSLPSTI